MPGFFQKSLMPIKEILSTIFAQTPLPNRLKSQKQRYEAGTLGLAAQVRIVEEYTDYRCSVVCEKIVIQ